MRNIAFIVLTVDVSGSMRIRSDQIVAYGRRPDGKVGSVVIVDMEDDSGVDTRITSKLPVAESPERIDVLIARAGGVIVA